jgi:hypothetical protein
LEQPVTRHRRPPREEMIWICSTARRGGGGRGGGEGATKREVSVHLALNRVSIFHLLPTPRLLSVSVPLFAPASGCLSENVRFGHSSRACLTMNQEGELQGTKHTLFFLPKPGKWATKQAFVF